MPKSTPNPVEEAVSTGESNSMVETVVLFATGNIQGSLLPTAPNQGGAGLLESYYKTAQQDFGTRVVWLDAGGIRGPSLESGFDDGRSFETFLSQSGMLVTLDGRHPHPGSTTDPDGSVSPAPYQELDRLTPSHLVVKADRIRLGLISASSEDEVVHQSQLARNEGADLVVWLNDMHIRCNPHLTRPSPSFRKPGETDGFCDGLLSEIAIRLPPGTVNAILTSGLDQPVNHFVYPLLTTDPAMAIPVVEAAPFGKSVALVYLTYDLQNHKLLGNKTRIEGPVPVCGKIFKAQGDCDEERPAPEAGRGALVRSRFHGRTAEPDSDVQKLAAPARAWVQAQEQVGLAQSTATLSANPRGESAFGDLVADALRNETHADFALVNPGLIKHAVGHSAFRPGSISWADLSRAIPADSTVDVIRVSGEELKILLRISENGLRGFASVSGLRLKLIRPDRDAPATDLTGAHKRVGWEQDRLLTVTNAEEEPISVKRTYRLAVPEFLVVGGDDWKWASQHFDLAHRTDPASASLSTRQLLATYLKRMGKIDSLPARIQFSEPHTKAVRRSHHRRGRTKHKT